jgi:hypothetical protein
MDGHPFPRVAGLLALMAAIAACTVRTGDGDGGSSLDDDDDAGVGGFDGGGGFDAVGGGGPVDDGVCVSTHETDVSLCDLDCDVGVEGDDGVVECTVSCDVDDQDCASGQFCQELEDGGGACLDDCSDDGVCPDPADRCDPDLLVCLPGSAPVTDGECPADNVASPEACDADCDATIDGGAGVYQCTVSCDPELQDCGDPSLFCQEQAEGGAACFFDCSAGNTCPGDEWYCDEKYAICVPEQTTG